MVEVFDAFVVEEAAVVQDDAGIGVLEL